MLLDLDLLPDLDLDLDLLPDLLLDLDLLPDLLLDLDTVRELLLRLRLAFIFSLLPIFALGGRRPLGLLRRMIVQVPHVHHARTTCASCT